VEPQINQLKPEMKTNTKARMLIVFLAILPFVISKAAQPATICAGAATLNNGSIVMIGQPFAGLTMAAGGSAQVQVGVIPVLTGGPSVSGPRFQMTFATQTGVNYVVQASTNLIAWTPIWTNIAAGESLLSRTRKRQISRGGFTE